VSDRLQIRKEKSAIKRRAKHDDQETPTSQPAIVARQAQIGNQAVQRSLEATIQRDPAATTTAPEPEGLADQAASFFKWLYHYVAGDEAAAPAAKGQTAPQTTTAAPTTAPQTTTAPAAAAPVSQDELTKQVAANMLADFKVTKTTEDILFANVPGLIGGMGYEGATMAKINKLLKAGKDKVQPLYKALLTAQKGSDATLIAAAQKAYTDAMTAFEAAEGKQAREIVKAYWDKKAEKKRKDAEKKRTQATAKRKAADEATKEASKVSLGAAATKLEGEATALEEAVKKLENAAARAIDTTKVAALVPKQQTTAEVEYDGYKMKYVNYQASALTYYADAYNLTKMTPPAATPPAAGTAAAVPAGLNDAQKRVYEIYTLMQAKSFSTPESKVLATIASGEGNFYTTQTLDRVRVSWGLIQFQGDSLMKVLKSIKADSATFWQENFGKYGILLQDANSPTATDRNSRTIAGSEHGNTSNEASGVDTLLVYDHAAKVWVKGNEGLAVIQSDPRYQALFSAAGSQDEGKTAQLKVARDMYYNTALATKVKVGDKTFALSEIFKTEKAIFGLVDRMVHEGNVSFMKKVLADYVAQKGIQPADLTSQSQADLTSFLAAYVKGSNEIRWNLLTNVPSQVGALSAS
jgi:hypothetical protein